MCYFINSSSLKSLIEKPPICGKEIVVLTPEQLTGFRLHPGPVSYFLIFVVNQKLIKHDIFIKLPEQYRLMTQVTQRKKHKHKKNKQKFGETPSHESQADSLDPMASGTHEKKHKKQKRHDEEKERKKKKKDKKKKKQKHSPELSNIPGVSPSLHQNSSMNGVQRI